ncbi:hypothetical protein DFJ73DRAFT_861119, partial [Zopfochytrium polystomum]
MSSLSTATSPIAASAANVRSMGLEQYPPMSWRLCLRRARAAIASGSENILRSDRLRAPAGRARRWGQNRPMRAMISEGRESKGNVDGCDGGEDCASSDVELAEGAAFASIGMVGGVGGGVVGAAGVVVMCGCFLGLLAELRKKVSQGTPTC